MNWNSTSAHKQVGILNCNCKHSANFISLICRSKLIYRPLLFTSNKSAWCNIEIEFLFQFKYNVPVYTVRYNVYCMYVELR